MSPRDAFNIGDDYICSEPSETCHTQ